MSALVILLLAALWAAILLPGALRARREHHPVASVDGFSKTMTTLAAKQRPPARRPSPGRAVLVLRDAVRVARVRGLPARSGGSSARPASGRATQRSPAVRPGTGRATQRSAAVRRRRATLTGLAAALTVNGILGASVGGAAWILTGLSATALVVYVALLAVLVPRARQAPQRAAEALRSLAAAPAPRDLTEAAAPLGWPQLAASVGSGAEAATDETAPRIIEIPGSGGLVSIRTVPRAGG